MNYLLMFLLQFPMAQAVSIQTRTTHLESLITGADLPNARYQWLMRKSPSGQSTVKFAAPNAPDTDVEFQEYGTYSLRVWLTDSSITNSCMCTWTDWIINVAEPGMDAEPPPPSNVQVFIQSVPAPMNLDTTKPFVTITGPKQTDPPVVVTAAVLQVNASATDNSGAVVEADLLIDGIVVDRLGNNGSPLPNTFSLYWRAKVIPLGLHLAEVRVYDGTGNSRSAQVTINKCPAAGCTQ